MSHKRFNLVCHGLMAYWQEGDYHLDVLIPDEGDAHFYGVGLITPDPDDGLSDPVPSRDHLTELPAGTLQLHGLKSGLMNAESLRQDLDIPLLRKGHFERTYSERNSIRVPMPDRVRCYSTAEVSPAVVRGTTDPALFHRIPSVLHDVVVLSWFDQTASSFHLEHENGEKYHARMLQPTYKLTWGVLGLYAQPPEHSVHALHQSHGASWNGMFRIKVSGKHPDLHLSAKGFIPDQPPFETAIGLHRDDLRSLASIEAERTDASGCGGGGGSC